MSTWIFTCNPKEYRISEAYKTYESIDWSITGRNYNVNINDIVYLYISAPLQKILFKTIVIDDQVNADSINNETSFYVVKNQKITIKVIRYVRLKLLIEFDKNIEILSLNYLVNNGYLNRHPQGKMKLDSKKDLDLLLDSILQKPTIELLKCELKSVMTSIANINSTETSATVKARIGQGAFRESLLSDRSCKCELCNIEVKKILYASHIKPWAKSNDSERIDQNNGLLLCSLHNDLFDKGYISFNSNGKIIVSQDIAGYLDVLYIDENVYLTLNKKQTEYMVWHFNNIFTK